MTLPDLKRKIRKLKNFEKTVRLQYGINEDIPLVWDKFFDLRNTGDKSVSMYSLKHLLSMSKDEYKIMTDEFFAFVYYEIYLYKGIIDAPVYDPGLLKRLDLPPIAKEDDVKKKFRELAKKYHPDKGGNPEKFIELMDIYKQL